MDVPPLGAGRAELDRRAVGAEHERVQLGLLGAEAAGGRERARDVAVVAAHLGARVDEHELALAERPVARREVEHRRVPPAADESDKLARFSSELQEIENHLPIDPRCRNPEAGRPGAHSRRQRNLCRRTTRTAVCRPPHSTCPTTSGSSSTKGTKRVMLKNIQEAKFKMCCCRSRKVALAAADQPAESLRRVLHAHPDARADARTRAAQHHGGRRDTTVRQELKDTYSAIEEAKADASGLWALQYLVDKGSLAEGHAADRCHRRFWHRHSAPYASG